MEMSTVWKVFRGKVACSLPLPLWDIKQHIFDFQKSEIKGFVR